MHVCREHMEIAYTFTDKIALQQYIEVTHRAVRASSPGKNGVQQLFIEEKIRARKDATRDRRQDA